MGSGLSTTAEQPPFESFRKHFAIRPKSPFRKDTRLASSQSGDAELSQASRVSNKVLERIFRFLAAGGYEETSYARLAAVRLVNRHWNHTARSLLHRQITLTHVKQLTHLVKTIDLVPSIRTQIVQLSVPRELLSDALRIRRSVIGGGLLSGGREQEGAQVKISVTMILFDLISKLQLLESLTIHAEYLVPTFGSPDDIIKSPHFKVLVGIRQLSITDSPAVQWPMSVGDQPIRHSTTNNPSFPFTQGTSAPVTSKAVTTPPLPGSKPLMSCLSTSLQTSRVRSLRLVDASSIYKSIHFQSFIACLSPTLEALTISSSNSNELDTITETLANTLPYMTRLIHLSTNAYQLRVLPPALHTLRISLAPNPCFCSGLTDPPPATQPSLQIGTIFDTISGVLNSIASAPLPPDPVRPSLSTAFSGITLKRLIIVDAPLEDFLQFNLTTSYDYPVEAARQNLLWMTASQLGVLVDVEREVRQNTR